MDGWTDRRTDGCMDGLIHTYTHEYIHTCIHEIVLSFAGFTLQVVSTGSTVHVDRAGWYTYATIHIRQEDGRRPGGESSRQCIRELCTRRATYHD